MDIIYRQILWCRERTADKVWTSFKVGSTAYCAWGRRGKKLQFKRHGAFTHVLADLEDKKRAKGYKEVDEFMLFTVFPDFKEQLEKELAFAMLANAIR